MQTLDFVSGLHNVSNYPNPSHACLYQAMQTQKKIDFYFLK